MKSAVDFKTVHNTIETLIFLMPEGVTHNLQTLLAA
jgi:hypothetical protein